MTEPVRISDHTRGVMNATRTRARMMVDSLKNMMTGLGTGTDKNTYARYGYPILDRGQLENAYRGDWVARKLITIPPYDATKEWRSWKADPKVIETIEETERRLGLQRRVAWVMTKDRLYGGAALVMGIGNDDPRSPLEIEKVKKDSLRYVHVLSRHELTSRGLVTDPSSAMFGLPEYYEINSSGTARTEIHYSRVIRFVECEMPDVSLTTGDGWGDSVLLALDDAVKNCGLSAGGIATLVAEAKNDVLSIPDFMNNVAQPDYREKLLERVALAQVSKSSQNTMIIDKEELFTRVNQSFTGLPDIYKLYLLVAAGAGDIPVTRFLSQSATGLGATGDENTRNYDDRITADQKVRIGPTLVSLDEVIIRSATGQRDPSIWYEWNPLRKATPAEQAELESKRAQTAKTYFDTGLIPEEIFQEAIIDRLVNDGTYPTLEKLWEDYVPPEEQDLPEGNEEVQNQFGKSKAKPGEEEDEADNDNEQTIEVKVARKKTGAKDAAHALMLDALGLMEDEFNEANIERAPNGQFGSGGAESAAKAAGGAMSKMSAEQISSMSVKGSSAERVAMRAALKGASGAQKTALQAKIVESFGKQHASLKNKDPVKAAKIAAKTAQYSKAYGVANPISPVTTSAQANAGFSQKDISGGKAASAAAQEAGAGKPSAADQKIYNQVAASVGAEKAAQYAKATAATPHSEFSKLSAAERSAIQAYTGSAYKSLNSSLRAGVMTQEQWDRVSMINAALDKLPNAEGTVYRKANLTSQQAGLYKVGMIVEERGFTSSSRVMGTWSGEYKYTIQSKTGKSVEAISLHPGEKEVVFRSGSRFKVTGIKDKIIYMEEVGGR